jgi:hypothetical protein
LVLLFCIIAGMVDFASSCNASGMQKCNEDYIAAVPQAVGNQSCMVLDTFLSCLNTACAGCPDAVKQQFNASVSPLKSGSPCGAGLMFKFNAIVSSLKSGSPAHMFKFDRLHCF